MVVGYPLFLETPIWKNISDPYNGLWGSPYNWVVSSIPYINQPTRGPFFHCSYEEKRFKICTSKSSPWLAHQPHRLWTSRTHGLDKGPRARGAFRGLSGGGDFFCRHFKTGKICAQHRTKISKAVRNHTEHFFWKRCGKDMENILKRNASRRKRYKKIWKRCEKILKKIKKIAKQ